MKPKDAILSGYYNHQKAIFAKILAEIQVISPSNKEKAVYIGYSFHNLYCALEDLFYEIAKTFENQVEDKSKFHYELLKKMCIEIPGIRPKVLSNESFLLLNELRGFRHVFRHSYDYELSFEKIEDLQKKIKAQIHLVEKDIELFMALLK